MARQRVRTHPIGTNQALLDELEFFVEGLGRFLFGADGEDFRRLRRFVPGTRNLSVLIDLFKGRRDRGIDEDLRFLHSELEADARRAATHATPDFREAAAVFSYRLYFDLAEHPARLLEALPPTARFEVASRLARGGSHLAAELARINAFAWLSVVGVPDLKGELTDGARAKVVLPELGAGSQLGLERLFQAARPALGPGTKAYYEAAFSSLEAEYRGQLVRLAASTQPLAGTAQSPEAPK